MVVINKKLSKQRIHDIKFGNVELDVDKINQLIEDQGVRVRVYRTILCPNIKSIDGGHHNIDCKLCDEGFIDRQPQDTWAVIQNQAMKRELKGEGQWDDHDAYATFISGIEIQYFAKIELMDYTTTFYQLIQRQEGEIDRLKYKAIKVNILIDKDNLEYFEGSDFTLSPTGDIQWTGARRPRKGLIYTVHYDYPITYRAIMASNINRFTNQKRKRDFKEPIHLPQRWQIKRDFLIDRVDMDDNPITKNRVFNYQDG